MEVVFLVASFLVVIYLIRIFALKLTEQIAVNQRNVKKANPYTDVFTQAETHDDNCGGTNTNSKIVLSGTLNYNDKQNLGSKYIGDVYRTKKGTFASKKELSNV